MHVNLPSADWTSFLLCVLDLILSFVLHVYFCCTLLVARCLLRLHHTLACISQFCIDRRSVAPFAFTAPPCSISAVCNCQNMLYRRRTRPHPDDRPAGPITSVFLSPALDPLRFYPRHRSFSCHCMPIPPQTVRSWQMLHLLVSSTSARTLRPSIADHYFEPSATINRSTAGTPRAHPLHSVPMVLEARSARRHTSPTSQSRPFLSSTVASPLSTRLLTRLPWSPSPPRPRPLRRLALPAR